MYIEYDYYLKNGGTQLDDATFFRAEFCARKIVDRFTQGRVRVMKTVPEAVERLMVELVNMESRQGAAALDTQTVTSFSNDGYSETYAAPLTREQVDAIESNMVLEYLSGEADDNGTPLLWLGVG